jgi:Leucine-rich repeat (LRR) protein
MKWDKSNFFRAMKHILVLSLLMSILVPSVPISSADNYPEPSIPGSSSNITIKAATNPHGGSMESVQSDIANEINPITREKTTVNAQDEVVIFPDAGLEAAIRDAIHKLDGDIYRSDLLVLTSFSAYVKGISDLTGIQYCTNLTELLLAGNNITDISLLSSLTNLTNLNLSYNDIGDVTNLATLTKLQTLGLYETQISNISSFDSLTKLTGLFLGNNKISNISALAGLTYLQELDLFGNQITNISPLASLTNLTYLRLANNQIKNISFLAGLTSLQHLDLFNNQISDISAFAGLTGLQYLNLYINQISDISALVANPGLGSGDSVNLSYNFLDLGHGSQNKLDIQELIDRGVSVSYEHQITSIQIDSIDITPPGQSSVTWNDQNKSWSGSANITAIVNGYLFIDGQPCPEEPLQGITLNWYLVPRNATVPANGEAPDLKATMLALTSLIPLNVGFASPHSGHTAVTFSGIDGASTVGLVSTKNEGVQIVVVPEYPTNPQINVTPVVTSWDFLARQSEVVPQVRWVGEMIVLEKYFGASYAGFPVIFTLENQSGGSLQVIGDFDHVGQNTIDTTVSPNGFASCILESDSPEEFDVALALHNMDGSVIKSEHAFAVYYLKFAGINLVNVQGERVSQDSGLWGPANPYLTTNDITARTLNIPQDALLRARVRGWFTNTNLNPARLAPEPVDTNGNGTIDLTIPEGAWVLPDDWSNPALMGAGPRIHWDIMCIPDGSVGAQDPLGNYYMPPYPLTTTEVGTANVVGPFSPGLELMTPAGWAILNPDNDAQYRPINTVVPDGKLNTWDAPMPPAKIILENNTNTDGYFKPAMKTDIYYMMAGLIKVCTNPFYQEMIPAHEAIPAFTNDEGYEWASFGAGPGAAQGAYPFWQITKSNDVQHPTSVAVYSDNHGEAMVWCNSNVVTQTNVQATAFYPYSNITQPGIKSNAVLINTINPGEIIIHKTNTIGGIIGLPGATFSISPNPYGSDNLTVADNSLNTYYDADPTNGTVHLINVPAGAYTITEITAPAGYALDATPLLGNVTASNPVLTLTLINMQGQIEVLLKDHSGNPLAGSTFTLTQTNLTSGNYTATVSDNSTGDGDQTSGIILFQNVPLGTYTVSEIAAPAGYVKEIDLTGVLVDSSALITLTFINELPTINSLVPNNGVQGATLKGVTINGNHLTGATAVLFSGTGVIATNLMVINDSQLKADVTIAGNAVAGTREVTLVTTAGTIIPLTGGFHVIDNTSPEEVRNFNYDLITGTKIKFSWSPSVSPDVEKYILYYDNGTGIIDYSNPIVSLPSHTTSWTTPQLPAVNYKFAIVAFDYSGNRVSTITTLLQVTLTYPDLVITSLNWSPEEPDYGDTLDVHTWVKNQGDNATDKGFVLAYYCDETLITTQYCSEVILPGNTVEIIKQWDALIKSKSYNFKVIVDSLGDRVVESNENNNTFIKTLNILPTYILRVSSDHLAYVEGEPINLVAAVSNSADPDIFYNDSEVNLCYALKNATDEIIIPSTPMLFDNSTGINLFKGQVNTSAFSIGEYTILATVSGSGKTKTISYAINIVEDVHLTLSTSRARYFPGEYISISGQVVNESGSPMAKEKVNLTLDVRGFEKNLYAYTNNNGIYTLNYQPSPGEGGLYSVQATSQANGLTRQAETSFSIEGLYLSPAGLQVNLVKSTSLLTTFKVLNIGSEVVTNLHLAIVDSDQADIVTASIANAELPVSLAPRETLDVALKIESALNSPDSALLQLAASGANLPDSSLNISVYLIPPVPSPVITPSQFKTGVNPGETEIQTINFSNGGYASLHNVRVLDPETTWINIVNGKIGDLAPSQGKSFEVRMQPAQDTDLGTYQVQIFIQCDEGQFWVNATIEVTSASVGNVSLKISDDTGSWVQSATVTLISQQSYVLVSGTEMSSVTLNTTPNIQSLSLASTSSASTYNKIVSGVTGADGRVDFYNLPAGDYKYQVDAASHDTAFGQTAIQPGDNSALSVNLVTQLVKLDWSVTETEIQDYYPITLSLKFETDVPKPVLLMTPLWINLSVTAEEIVNGQLTVTNPSLVDINDLYLDASNLGKIKLVFDSTDQNNSLYHVDKLEAKQTLTVPYRATLNEATNLDSEYVGSIKATGKYVYFGVFNLPMEGTVENQVAVYFDDPRHLIVSPSALFYVISDTGLVSPAANVPYRQLNVKNGGGGTVHLEEAQAFTFEVGLNITAASLDVILKLNYWTGQFNASSLEIGESTALDIESFDSIIQGLILPGVNLQAGLLDFNYIYPNSDLQSCIIPISLIKINKNNITIPVGTGSGGSGWYGPGWTGISLPTIPGPTVHEVVKLDLSQNATLEREGFTATLDITALVNNLQDVQTELVIKGINNNDAGEKFQYVKTPSTGIISGVVSTGKPGTVKWAIVPNNTTGGSSPDGEQYKIGAILHFAVNGQSYDLATDYEIITVKPQPSLIISYYIPAKVKANQPFIAKVTVYNEGPGLAHNFSLDSVQPRITENLSGLAIKFNILGSAAGTNYVDGKMKIEFGDISSGQTVNGYWSMISTLDGEFTDFKAAYTHQNYEGMQLTPLIKKIYVHIVRLQIEMTSASKLHMQSSVNIPGPGVLSSRFIVSITYALPNYSNPDNYPTEPTYYPLNEGDNSFDISETVDFKALNIPRFEENVQINIKHEISLNYDFSPILATFEDNLYLPLPVIIIHGYPYGGVDTDLGHIPEWLATMGASVAYQELKTALENNSYKDDGEYRTLWWPKLNQDIRYYPREMTATYDTNFKDLWVGTIVDNWVNNAIKHSWASRVNLIGHSTGGLLARYYVGLNLDQSGTDGKVISGEGGVRNNKVNKIITVGTPHLGITQFYKTAFTKTKSDFEEMEKLKVPLPGTLITIDTGLNNIGNWFAPTYPSIMVENPDKTITPGSNPINNSFNTVTNPEINYYSLYTIIDTEEYKDDDYKTPEKILVKNDEQSDNWYIYLHDEDFDDGDSYVLADSAGYIDSTYVNWDAYYLNSNGIKHGDLCKSNNFISKIENILSNNSYISTSQTNLTTLNGSVNSSSDNATLSWKYDPATQGTNKYMNVTFNHHRKNTGIATNNSINGAFFAQSGSPSLDLVLHDPNGRDISVQSSYPDVLHTSGNTYEEYQITNPPAGDWSFEVRGVDVPEGGEDFSLDIYLQNNLVPIASLADSYTGQPELPIEFNTSGSYDPDGSIVSYQWDFDGDGIFDNETADNQITHTWEQPYTGIVVLKVTDDKGASSTTSAYVLITEPQSPSDIILDNTTIEEYQPVNTLIGTFTTTDNDSIDNFTYSLVSGEGDDDNGYFNINGSGLYSAVVFDYDVKNSFTIRVRTTDSDGLSFEKAFIINITSIAKTKTTTSLTSSHNPSVFGQPVTFIATVSPVPDNGTIRFKDNETYLCEPQNTDGEGLASFNTTDLSAGIHTIIAEYSGSNNFVSSSSNSIGQLVEKAATTIQLTSSANPSIFGQSVTFTSIVMPVLDDGTVQFKGNWTDLGDPQNSILSDNKTPTGTVTFFDGENALGTYNLTGSGEVIFMTSALTPGQHNITAEYGGDENYNGSISDQVIQIVNITTLYITTSSLSDGEIKTSYTQSLKAINGTGTYRWSVIKGKLPKGLSLKSNSKESSNPVISGTPSAPGKYTFTIQVKDKNKQIAEKEFAIQIYFTPNIVTTFLSAGKGGEEYIQQLQAEGGHGSYTWAIASGSLPPGIKLDSETGLISGIPDTYVIIKDKKYLVRFSVTDEMGGKTKSKSLSLKISVPLTITTASPLANGDIGIKYRQSLKAIGGSGNYKWSLADNSTLPNGFSLSKNGVISGKANKSGTNTFIVIVNNGTYIVQKEFSLTINESLKITTSFLPDGAVGQIYLDGIIPVKLEASGGDEKYTWTIIGSLPSGLQLDKSTGIISGTPKKVGSKTFTIKVTDGLKAITSVKLTIKIN